MTATDDAPHRWHLLSNLGATFAALMRLVPRRWRFGLAQLIARAAVPLVRRSEVGRVLEQSRVDTAPEIALHLVLHTLSKNGTEFDPVIALDGYDDLVRACREGRGVMLVSPHAALGLIATRFYHEDGLRPVIISADPLMKVGGTRMVIPTLQPVANFLVRARTRLRDGWLVGAMVDRAEHHGERTFEFETANGPVILAPALLQLAVRCGARVIFTECHVERGRLTGSWVAPSSNTVEGLTAEFIEFVRSHVDARLGDAAVSSQATPRRASSRLQGAET